MSERGSFGSVINILRYGNDKEREDAAGRPRVVVLAVVALLDGPGVLAAVQRLDEVGAVGVRDRIVDLHAGGEEGHVEEHGHGERRKTLTNPTHYVPNYFR